MMKAYLSKIKKKTEYLIKDWFQNNISWKNIPSARLIYELNLREWGGCQLFVDDINNDGSPEFLWLQSLGIFKSQLFQNTNLKQDDNFRIHDRNIFCLTATDMVGNVLWQIGTPYSGSAPYISHATEQMITVADIDGDGLTEVLALNSEDKLLVIDGDTGKIKNMVRLPADNFVTVKTGFVDRTIGEKIVLVGVSDKAYPPYQYANPWLFIDASLNILYKKEFIGAGHQVAVLDANKDMKDEFMIGYQLVDPKGDVLWTMGEWENKNIDPFEQHVDNIESCWIDGKWYAAIAGSDYQYWVDSNGHTLWSHQLPHPQFCVIGKNTSEVEILVLNQRISIICYDQDGQLLWEGMFPEHWPKGRPPGAFSRRPIHCNVAAIPISSCLGENENKNKILYKEGGWPYIVDFYGNICMKFPYGNNYKQPKYFSSSKRLNDVGLSYDSVVYDLDSDGNEEVVIYNRDHAWIFKLENQIS